MHMCMKVKVRVKKLHHFDRSRELILKMYTVLGFEIFHKIIEFNMETNFPTKKYVTIGLFPFSPNLQFRRVFFNILVDS